MKRRINRIQHAVDIVEDICIPEAQNAIASAFQPRRAAGVFLFGSILGMRWPIEFDHNPRAQTNKVYDIKADRRLSAEVRFNEGHAAERAPQTFFGARRIGAKSFSVGATKAFKLVIHSHRGSFIRLRRQPRRPRRGNRPTKSAAFLDIATHNR